jgi:hypothetical protein
MEEGDGDGGSAPVTPPTGRAAVGPVRPCGAGL